MNEIIEDSVIEGHYHYVYKGKIIPKGVIFRNCECIYLDNINFIDKSVIFGEGLQIIGLKK